jgi:hypothetical protein
VAALRAAGYPATKAIGRVLPREQGEFAPLVHMVCRNRAAVLDTYCWL